MPAKKQERFSPPAVGGISLLVVFAVLCLTVFALLSLTTVQADVRLADASAQAVQDYYAADCQAQAIFAYLRTGEAELGAVPEGIEISVGIDDYFDEHPIDTTYYYVCPISETQELQVEVRICEDGTYTIANWRSAPAGEWESDETMKIWDGTSF